MQKIKRAFTLVEMLIVVVIIGILASALIPRLTWAQERARDTARKWNLNQLQAALNTYFSDNGMFPWDFDTNNISDIRSEIVPQYMKSIPEDPQKTRKTLLVITNTNADCDSDAASPEWQYAYAPITRNASIRSGMVVAANVESEWNNANWVRMIGYGAWDAIPWYDTSEVNPDRLNLSDDWCVSNVDADDPTVNTEAVELEKTVCDQWVKIDADLDWGTLSGGDCAASVNEEMLYIVIQ